MTHELRYEDVLGDPRGSLAALASQAGIDGRFNLAHLETGHNDRHLQTWLTMAGTISREDRRGIERQVRRYGYSLREPYVLPFDGIAPA